MDISNCYSLNQFSFTQCNILAHHVPSFKSLLSAIVSTLLCFSPLSFPVTGNSHNCRPKRLSVSRQQGQAWLRLNARLHWEFFSHQETKDAVSHLKGSATYTAIRRSKISIHLSLELSLKLAHTEDCLTATAAVSQGGLSAVSRSSIQSGACNSPKGRQRVPMTSSFEEVTVKDLKSGSRQVMR